MSRHRAEVRPRYGRIATLGSSLAVTVIAVLGGAGVLPSSADDGGEQPRIEQAASEASDPPAVRDDSPDPSADPSAEPSESQVPATEPGVALPAVSGQGTRVVYSEGRQRVWLVRSDEVLRTYPVSGSVYDNLDPGTYEVYSRSEDAVGIDDSGTMKYFVRFTQGDEGAAIGFHDIPVDDGSPVQTAAQLGTPLSHGCIRQARPDAIALWHFAPIGTTVVVTS